VEKHIEAKCRKFAKARGHVFWKLVVQGYPGVPDRLMLSAGGRVVFIEFKAPGKKPTPLQAAWHSRLRALGFEVHVIDNVLDFESICP
tara:strand:+ start:8830 stop:9093 length:264 start_codon:yes stop_codon:yes gene_type:complete